MSPMAQLSVLISMSALCHSFLCAVTRLALPGVNAGIWISGTFSAQLPLRMTSPSEL